jgi:hypothetical protein
MVRAATVSSIQFGRPSEVADLAAAILTDAYLTKQVISLDGITQGRYQAASTTASGPS